MNTNKISDGFLEKLKNGFFFFLLPFALLSTVFPVGYLFYSVSLLFFLAVIWLISSFLPREFRFLPLLLFVLFCSVNSDLIQGKRFVSHDTYSILLHFSYLLDSFRQGNFPYWNNYYNMGEPFFVYSTSLLFPIWYPFALIGAFFNGNTIALFNLSYVGSVLFLISGCYLFLSLILKRKESVFLCLTALLFSPITVDYLREPSSLNMLLYLPYLLYTAITFLQDNRKRFHFILFCFFLGLTANVYVPQYSVYPFLLIFLASLLSAKYSWGFLKDRSFIPSFAAGFLILALLSSPVTYVFTYFQENCFSPVRWEGKLPADPETTNTLSVDIETSADYSSHGKPYDLLTLIIKNTGIYLTENGLTSELSLYVGLIVFVLALYGTFLSSSPHRISLLLALGLIGTLMFGYSHIHFLLLHNLVPGFGTIRNTEFYLTYFALGVVILAGLGFDMLMNRERMNITLIASLLGLTILLLAALSILLKNLIPAHVFRITIFSDILIGIFFLALLVREIEQRRLFFLLLFLIVLDSGHFYSDRKDKLTNSVNVANGHFNVINTKGLAWNERNEKLLDFPIITAPYNGSLTERTAVLRNAPNGMADFIMLKDYWYFQRDFGESLDALFERKVSFASNYIAFPNQENVRNALKNAVGNPMDVSLANLAFIENKDEAGMLKEKGGNHSPKTAFQYRILDYSSDRASFEITTSGEGLFVYNDTYEEHWEAYLNQRKVPVLRVNGIAKGILIEEPGTYTVDFVYNNQPYRLALYAYFSVICAMIGYLLLRSRLKFKKTPP